MSVVVDHGDPYGLFRLIIAVGISAGFSFGLIVGFFCGMCALIRARCTCYCPEHPLEFIHRKLDREREAME
jgi:hypothetical protein